MKKLLLIICCLGIFFSSHAQDKPVGNIPIKSSEVISMPKGEAFEMATPPPKFVECTCSKYNVSIGKGDSAMVSMKNGSSVIFQNGQQLVVKKVLNCNSGVTGELNCSGCQQFQWKIIDENGTDLVAWSTGEVPTTIGTKMKCDMNYKLVLQGRCGCTLCPPFIVNLRKSCCNCEALSQNMTISGMNEMCLTKDCDQTFTYSVPAIEPSSCITYKWNIKNEMGLNVSYTGQGSNKISFNCKGLKAGTYYINLTIKCQDKTISLNKQLVLCKTPNSLIDARNVGQSTTAVPVYPAENDYWILVDDLDKNCQLSVGDVAHSINNQPMEFTLINPTTPITPFSFTDLPVDKSYIILHVSINKCGNSFCWSYDTSCFTVSNNSEMRAMAIKSIPSNIMDIPLKLRKGLPKKVFETSSVNESIKD